MAVTAAQIRELREISGAGMTDCKNALTETGGDIQKAVVILREKGLAAAAKKAGRIAAEGLCTATISDDGKIGVIVEVNCETDFVAKNQQFKDFVSAIANQIIQHDVLDLDALLETKWILDPNLTVNEAVNGKIATIGENIGIRRFGRFVKKTDGFFATYIHGEGKVAVLVEISGEKNDAIAEAGKNVCMQIAMYRPVYVSKDEVSPEFIEQEKDILTKQALNEGKDAKVVEKMIAGRLNKRLKEVCLLDQEYIKDADTTVGKYFDAASKASNASATITRFACYEKGEGIAKKEENFADEVSKLTN